MSNITNFEYIERDPLYNKKLNRERRSIFDLSPIGFKWKYADKDKNFIFSYAGVVCVLERKIGFAVVDTNKKGIGKAYILNIDGRIHKEINYSKNKYQVDNFYYVYYKNNELCFIIIINNYDYELKYDELTDEIIICNVTRF